MKKILSLLLALSAVSASAVMAGPADRHFKAVIDSIQSRVATMKKDKAALVNGKDNTTIVTHIQGIIDPLINKGISAIENDEEVKELNGVHKSLEDLANEQDAKAQAKVFDDIIAGVKHAALKAQLNNALKDGKSILVRAKEELAKENPVVKNMIDEVRNLVNNLNPSAKLAAIKKALTEYKPTPANNDVQQAADSLIEKIDTLLKEASTTLGSIDTFKYYTVDNITYGREKLANTLNSLTPEQKKHLKIGGYTAAGIAAGTALYGLYKMGVVDKIRFKWFGEEISDNFAQGLAKQLHDVKDTDQFEPLKTDITNRLGHKNFKKVDTMFKSIASE